MVQRREAVTAPLVERDEQHVAGAGHVATLVDGGPSHRGGRQLDVRIDVPPSRVPKAISQAPNRGATARRTARPPVTGMPVAERCGALMLLAATAPAVGPGPDPPAPQLLSMLLDQGFDSPSLDHECTSLDLFRSRSAAHVPLGPVTPNGRLTTNQEYSNIGLCLCLSAQPSTAVERSITAAASFASDLSWLLLAAASPSTRERFLETGQCQSFARQHVRRCGHRVRRSPGTGRACPHLLGRRRRRDVVHRDAHPRPLLRRPLRHRSRRALGGARASASPPCRSTSTWPSESAEDLVVFSNRFRRLEGVPRTGRVPTSTSCGRSGHPSTRCGNSRCRYRGGRTAFRRAVRAGDVTGRTHNSGV